MCPVALERKLNEAKVSGSLPKVVVPVHLCGQPCDMAAIYELSQRFGFYLIEDASHAIGGRYKGQPVGHGRYSDITIFSFHPVKIITTAEGGLAVTNSSEMASRMELLRSHGITRTASQMTQESSGPCYYEQIDLGFNYRMTDLQAALGLSQFDRLDAYVAQRHQLARRYDELLKELPLTLPWQHPDGYSGLHLYVIRLDLDKSNSTQSEIIESLRGMGIGVNVHYIPVHTQPYYRAMGFRSGQFPEAEAYYREAISLPMFPTMTRPQQDEVVAGLQTVLSA
jgi:dTDP-4-amino-4,6-dideoxygalactose transaminase